MVIFTILSQKKKKAVQYFFCNKIYMNKMLFDETLPVRTEQNKKQIKENGEKNEILNSPDVVRLCEYFSFVPLLGLETNNFAAPTDCSTAKQNHNAYFGF